MKGDAGGHRLSEQGAPQRADGGQPVLAALPPAGQLGLRPAGGEVAQGEHRGDAPCRQADRPHHLPRRPSEPADARPAAHRREPARDARLRPRGRASRRARSTPRRGTTAAKVGDYVSMNLFEELMADEEGHIDYLETQIDLVEPHRRAELGPAQRASRPTRSSSAGAMKARVKWIEDRTLRRPDRERPSRGARHRARRGRQEARAEPDGAGADRHRRLLGLGRRQHPGQGPRGGRGLRRRARRRPRRGGAAGLHPHPHALRGPGRGVDPRKVQRAIDAVDPRNTARPRRCWRRPPRSPTTSRSSTPRCNA